MRQTRLSWSFWQKEYLRKIFEGIQNLDAVSVHSTIISRCEGFTLVRLEYGRESEARVVWCNGEFEMLKGPR
jgi:hypothetical protein